MSRIQRIHLRRDYEIVFREPADRMRPEREGHPAVGNCDVGMMVLLFRDFRDSLHEVYRLNKVFEFPLPLDGFPVIPNPPPRSLFQQGVCFLERERQCSPFAGDAFFAEESIDHDSILPLPSSFDELRTGSLRARAVR